MSDEPICPYCGDGMESVGTLNHIECVVAVVAERDALRDGRCPRCEHMRHHYAEFHMAMKTGAQTVDDGQGK